MKVLKIIPKIRIGLDKPQTLTYFSKENIQTGGVVLIKIRKRRVIGIVIEAIDFKEAKMSLRKGEKFSLKPIEKTLSSLSIFDENIFELIHWTSRYYFEAEGIILKNVLPDVSQKKWKELEPERLRKTKKDDENQNTILHIDKSMNITEKKVETKKEYYENLEWKKFEKLLKNFLAREGQCLVLYPEIAKLTYEFEKLKPEIRKKVVLFNSEIKKEEFWKSWTRILNGESLVIFSTRQGVFLPFKKLNLIIIQDESSFSHKSRDQHPKYNAKHVALKLSGIYGAKVIFNDLTPSLESYLNIKNKKYSLNSSVEEKPNKAGIIDMDQMIDSRMKFSYISPRLKTEIQKTIEENGKILLFQNRRGSATYVFCKDCGYYYSCPNCDFSLVYHKSENKLVCHWCGHKENLPKTCRKCKGETIKYSGHGTQKIFEEVSELFPDVDVTMLDYDNARTNADRLKLREEFIDEKEAGIMIATSIILSIPKINFNFSAILNYDLLINFPDYQTNERIVRLIRRLMKSTDKLYIQSYNVQDQLLLNLARGRIENIYKKELMLRQDLYYPPYWHFLVLKFSHKNEQVIEKEAKKLYNLLIEENLNNKNIQILGPLLSIRAKSKGKFTRSIIIKSKKDELVRRNKLLTRIPSKWDIDVDPIEI